MKDIKENAASEVVERAKEFIKAGKLTEINYLNMSAAILLIGDLLKALTPQPVDHNEVVSVMARAIYGDMFPDRDGWDNEPDKWLKNRYADTAKAALTALQSAGYVISKNASEKGE